MSRLYVTAREMRLIDEITIKEHKISADVLMDRAGRKVAGEILKICRKKPVNLKCLAICGTGNNGGDGLVASRYLLEQGVPVEAFIIKPADGTYKGLVFRNLQRAFFKHLTVREIENDLGAFNKSLLSCDVVIDALLGTGSAGAPKGIMAETIKLINSAGKKVFSVDIPTGLDADTGEPFNPCIEADYTLAIGLPKKGFAAKAAKPCIGKTKVLDIGFPKEAIERVILTRAQGLAK